MSTPLATDSVNEGFTGLKELKSGLPAAWYYDPKQYELELAQIWYRNWIYVGRSDEVKQPRSYMTFDLGDQKLLLVRDDEGKLQAFHNTCRHRGAALCPEGHGSLRSPNLVCRYHAWVYDLEGALLRTSSKSVPSGFDPADYSLYKVKVTEWRGFVFVALRDDSPPLAEFFDQKFNLLDRWPLEDLALAHVATKIIQCNWKVFWENFSECLHCPAVHPKLSQLVPIFGRALLRERDDPNWRAHADDQDPRYKGGLRAGALSWSMNGNITGDIFPGLTEQDRKAGQVYVTSIPTGFIVAHIDYVRAVRVRPLGPEQTELRVEYLFAPEVLAKPNFNLSNVVDFADLVMGEDADICELNQHGLRALPHRAGVLMPEEYRVQAFHEWLRAQLARPRE
jgi:Rieske 2Fe-2S family protein